MDQLILYIKLIYANFGWVGLIVAYFLADKWLYPLWKKKAGTWVSYESLERRIKSMEDLIHVNNEEERKTRVDLDILQKSYLITNKNVEDSINHIMTSVEATRTELSHLMNVLIQRK
mgnify:CR=1 FL=1